MNDISPEMAALAYVIGRILAGEDDAEAAREALANALAGGNQ